MKYQVKCNEEYVWSCITEEEYNVPTEEYECGVQEAMDLNCGQCDIGLLTSEYASSGRNEGFVTAGALQAM